LEEGGDEGTTRVRGSGPKVRSGDVYVDMLAARFGISNVPSVSATRRALCVCAVPLVASAWLGFCFLAVAAEGVCSAV
jgi:hypothetical protein